MTEFRYVGFERESSRVFTKIKKNTVATRLLAQACVRNTSVEIQLEDSSGQTKTWRTRLLFVKDERLIAEVPRLSRDNPIPLSREIDVYMLLGGIRYRFASVVEESGLKIALNEKVRVLGMKLKLPAEVLEDQRRANYRLSLAAGEPLLVSFCLPHPSILHACEINTQVTIARIVNISAGGLAVLVDQQYARTFQTGTNLFGVFVLPDCQGTFTVLCKIRHTQKIEASASVRAGIAFCEWPGCNLKDDQLRIMRFIASHERQYLQRRK